MSVVISANFNNMQFCTQISQLILIFLQILFSKYFKYINSEFVYIFSFSICLFRRKCQGSQFCKNVCKLEIPCKFFVTFIGFFELSRHRTIYLRVHLGHFGHICQIGGHRTHPNIYINLLYIDTLYNYKHITYYV